MNRKELQSELLKLAPQSYDGDFREHLSKLLKDYLNLLKEFDGYSITKDWNDAYAMIEKLCESIKETVKRVYIGQHSLAYSLLRTRLNEMPEAYGKYAAFKKDSLFYRMRVFDDKTKEKPSRKGLFHIPFNLRGIVKTERYSTPGYPCLYLGTSSYICWEEMNRPNLNKCYVSRFCSEKEFSLLNMSLPKDDLLDDTDYLLGLLVRYPLIIASMIEVKNKDDVFKPEYIIPQLMMEWIMEQINSSKAVNHPVGIFYTSVHVKEGFEYPEFVYNNLAIPAQSPFAGKYSKELCELFSVSEPTSDEIEHAKGTYNRADNIMLPPKVASKSEMKKFMYKSSMFGILERQLEKNKIEYPSDHIEKE